MSGDIHIGQLQAGNAHVGGQKHVITGESGIINNYADPLAVRAELQSALDELLRAITENRVGPAVRESVEQARTEADESQPRTARLRELMNTVIVGVGNVGSIAQAALNVLSVINKLPW